MTEDEYNFLHGYPTKSCINYWHHLKTNRHQHPGEHACQYRPYHIREHWQHWPEADTFECQDCWRERKRRARVLCMASYKEQETRRLQDPRFAAATLITPYNVAVFYFAQQCALNFVHQNSASSFWIQAIDSPPNWYASGYSSTELQEQKKRWLAYHAKKNEGILSLLMACYNMPYRVTDSHGKNFAEFGIHNGAQCILKGWQLSDADLSRTQTLKHEHMVLQELPKVLYLEMLTPMHKPYPELPSGWFPMTPVNKKWCLDSEAKVDIWRRGFPLVPNFSTTIDSARGKT